jgi:hypothetical protein
MYSTASVDIFLVPEMRPVSIIPPVLRAISKSETFRRLSTPYGSAWTRLHAFDMLEQVVVEMVVAVADGFAVPSVPLGGQGPD